MKVVVITAMILVVFLGGAVFFNQYIHKSCEQMLQPVQLLDQAILSGNWEEIKRTAEQVNTAWQQNRKVWVYMLGHDDIDAIDLALERLDRYILMEDHNHTYNVSGEIGFMVELIRKKESLTLSNLF